ncbi:MAG: glycoside hydrolase family 18 protein [Carbonactinosporaceae bacterium]
MSRSARLAVLAAVLTAAAATATVTVTIGPGGSTARSERPAYLKIADFATWRSYGHSDGHSYLVKDIDTSGAAAKLTHVEYSFGGISRDGRCLESNEPGLADAFGDYQRLFDAQESVDGVADTADQPLAGNFHQIRELKDRHPDLKVVFSLGGWGGSRYFSDAARSAASRRAFTESCIDLFIKGDLPRLDGRPQGGPGAAQGVFDGIDIDWEWPGADVPGNVVRQSDRRNLTLLLREFRRQLDAYGEQAGRHYSLSVVLPPSREDIQAGFQSPEIFRHVDYATVTGFDLHGSWESRTNHAAQLFTPPGDPSDERLSVDRAVSTWLHRGAPPCKLSVAVPAFGRGWRGVPARNDGLYQRARGPAPGPVEEGAQDYRVLADLRGERFRDTEHGALWLYFGASAGAQWWSYDDPAVIRRKATYVREHGLGGMTMWSLDGDDGRASLVSAIDAGLRAP